ncbi:hypothetical protein Z968_02170 [Clostridium novyi A str. 4552]|uniref:Uncharacterized protein n=2 Tax=Clostridium novyi TaxID=1542 RepID=A0A0A0IA94_CLONO|nr:hypothetical protein Z968_02170 [Clostridium novyi A str. 4552]
MSRLRAYTANGGAVYDLFKRKINYSNQENFCISKKSVNSVIKRNYEEKFNNVKIINSGKKTWLRCLLKSLRGA